MMGIKRGLVKYEVNHQLHRRWNRPKEDCAEGEYIPGEKLGVGCCKGVSIPAALNLLPRSNFGRPEMLDAQRGAPVEAFVKGSWVMVVLLIN